MESCSYLIEVILDGESEGKLPFDCNSTVACDVFEKFSSDAEVSSELGVDLVSLTLKRMEKFSAKFGDWMRTKQNAILCDGDRLRFVIESNPGITCTC